MGGSGKSAGSNDEWIELYNRTDKAVALNGMILYAKTNKPYIPLAGTIAPRSYYLLERTDDATVNDIAADLVYGNDGADWALNNSPADVLILSYASTTMDQTPICGSGNQWCVGSSAYEYLSMERIDYDVASTNTSN